MNRNDDVILKLFYTKYFAFLENEKICDVKKIKDIIYWFHDLPSLYDTKKNEICRNSSMNDAISLYAKKLNKLAQSFENNDELRCLFISTKLVNKKSKIIKLDGKITIGTPLYKIFNLLENMMSDYSMNSSPNKTRIKSKNTFVVCCISEEIDKIGSFADYGSSKNNTVKILSSIVLKKNLSLDLVKKILRRQKNNPIQIQTAPINYRNNKIAN